MTKSKTTPKPGFFQRIFQKIDRSMKEKAEKASQESCCCGPDKKKDSSGKCS